MRFAAKWQTQDQTCAMKIHKNSLFWASRRLKHSFEFRSVV
jgi:hypothetical protein